MPIFGSTINLNGNAIVKVKQHDELDSVVILRTMNAELEKKANTYHVHSLEEIEALDTVLQNITVDGGTL